MTTLKTHITRRKHRRFIAAVMACIYLLIMLMPLASLAMNSKSVVHAVTGECSGDCNICGCSPVSRANNTCCCARNKQQHAAASQLADDGCCSSKKPAAAATAVKGDCCDTSRPAQPVVAENDCCAGGASQLHDEKTPDSGQKAAGKKADVVLKCGCPCGKSKLPTLAGTGSTELLPYLYAERITTPYEATRYSLLSQRKASRHAEPPDPPPKQPLFS